MGRFVQKISMAKMVEQEISIRYETLPIEEFIKLIKSRQPLKDKEKYVIEFFREVKPENREKFRIEQNISEGDMEYLYNQVKDIPAVKYINGSVYGT